ncbi:protein hfq [Rhodococcus sp. WS1]|nr:protein hfq [Rhodococcus erythropolis]MBQ7808416.1 protein hfq [Rhodococcus sp. (in: high G+C Gram-positive bacteria)]NRH30292.1 protein hfq [Rhodococcus sp. MS13]ROZ53450.1 protein hfq [Rhodococcus sp. WS1]TQC36847.1 protein hfq [Rhodococcus sp. WS7]
MRCIAANPNVTGTSDADHNRAGGDALHSFESSLPRLVGAGAMSRYRGSAHPTEQDHHMKLALTEFKNSKATIRIIMSDGAKLNGTVTDFTEDTLVLNSPNGVYYINPSHIIRLFEPSDRAAK